jgi:hypothetical protein
LLGLFDEFVRVDSVENKGVVLDYSVQVNTGLLGSERGCASKSGSASNNGRAVSAA